MAWQCRGTDRCVWHHLVGALAVRADIEGVPAGGLEDADPALRVRLYRTAIVFVFLGTDRTAKRWRPARLRRRADDHRRRLQLRCLVHGLVGLSAASSTFLILFRRRLCVS